MNHLIGFFFHSKFLYDHKYKILSHILAENIGRKENILIVPRPLMEIVREQASLSEQLNTLKFIYIYFFC